MNLRTAYLLGGLVFVWPLLLSSIAFAADPAQEPPIRDSSSCELVIDGKDIGKIVLINELGLEKVLTRPCPSELLPSGRYRIRQIELQGGYNYYSYIDNAKDTFILSPEAPCKLKAGAPLTPSVNVKRQGRVLSLDYQLLDADGRKFINQERTNPPQFAIHQGDQKIASGSFEYG